MKAKRSLLYFLTVVKDIYQLGFFRNNGNF
jgi:hypothetical protein